MSKLAMVALCDVKAGSFLRPGVFGSTAEAVRMFGDLTDDKDTLIGKHPGDFQLFHIADVDGDTCDVTPVYPHALLASGSDFARKDV